MSFLISRAKFNKYLSPELAEFIVMITIGSSFIDSSLTIGSLASSGNLASASLTASRILSSDIFIESTASNLAITAA